MHRTRTTALAAACCLAAGVSACGGGGSDEDQVRDVAKLIAKSDKEACGEFTDAFLKKSFGGKKSTCEKSAEENKASGEVGAVTIDGDNATAVVKGDGEQTKIKFVNQDGDWKADDFEQR
jgi:hypothetical protein